MPRVDWDTQSVSFVSSSIDCNQRESRPNLKHTIDIAIMLYAQKREEGGVETGLSTCSNIATLP